MLLRPKILTEGLAETPLFQAALAEYLGHCASIGNIIAGADDDRDVDARIEHYFRAVGVITKPPRNTVVAKYMAKTHPNRK